MASYGDFTGCTVKQSVGLTNDDIFQVDFWDIGTEDFAGDFHKVSFAPIVQWVQDLIVQIYLEF